MDKLVAVMWMSLVTLTWLAAEVHSQPNYEVIAEKIEFDKKYDLKDIMKIHYAMVTRFNRTMYVVNVSFDLLLDLPTDAQFELIAYEQMPNLRYSKIPIPIAKGKMCDYIDNDKYMYKNFLKYSNFKSKCPITKAWYWVRDYYLDASVLPPELPGNRWRGDFTYTFNGKTQIKFSTFLYIDRDI